MRRRRQDAVGGIRRPQGGGQSITRTLQGRRLRIPHPPYAAEGAGGTRPSRHVGAKRAATAKSRWAVSWGPTVPPPESVYSREMQATAGRR